MSPRTAGGAVSSRKNRRLIRRRAALVRQGFEQMSSCATDCRGAGLRTGRGIRLDLPSPHGHLRSGIPLQASPGCKHSGGHARSRQQHSRLAQGQPVCPQHGADLPLSCSVSIQEASPVRRTRILRSSAISGKSTLRRILLSPSDRMAVCLGEQWGDVRSA